MKTPGRSGIVLALVVLFGVLGVPPSRADTQWLPFWNAPSAGLEPSVTPSPRGTDAVEVRVDVFGLNWEEVSTKAGPFVRIDVPEAGLSTEIGKPRLPVIRRLIEIPYDADVALEVLSAESREIYLPDAGISHPILPTQAPVPKIPGAAENAPFALDSASYAEDAFSPSEVAQVGEVSFVRGHRVVQISIYPVQYNPARSTVRCFARLNILVTFSGGNLGKTRAMIDRYRSPSFEKLLEGTILNFGQLEPGPSPKATSSDGVLIIAANGLESALQPLADWKRQKGFKVALVTTATTGSTTTQIKNYIQSVYTAWSDPSLSYVVLAGDTNTIPSFSGTTGSHVSDLYYATLSGTDYLPDVWIGRLSVATSSQAEAVASRAVRYERADVSATAWLKKASFIATCDTGFYQVAEGTHNYVISQYMNPRAYASDKLYCITYGAGTADVRNAVNAGRVLVTYSGHGSETSWAGPTFTTSNVDSLTNGDMTPFVTSHACLTGSIQISECFGEKWLRKAAVGFWGASNSTYWDEDDYLERGMYKALYDQHLYALGQMARYGLEYVYAVYGGGGLSKYYFEVYHLLGDPTLELWTAEPAPLTVYHDSTAVVGQTNLLVTVQAGGLPVRGASVCVDKPSDGVHETVETDSSGKADITMSPALATPGTLTITVTRHDAVPYQGSVAVIEPAGAYLSYAGHSFEDIGGGGDGYASPGESVVMPVTLRNLGTDSCLQPHAELHTTDPWVEAILDPTAEYPDIDPSNAHTSYPPHVAWKSYSSTPDRTLIRFTLDWSCQGGGDGTTFFLVEICADADTDGYTSCAGDCDDWDGSIHPGAEEVCDGLDNDCDGSADEGFADLDNDGAASCVDCDDTDPSRYPGALEACDGIDNDCDGIVPAGEADADGDGVRICAGDCDDADPAVHPGATEICNDGKDNDCDGATDSADSDCGTGWSLASSATVGDTGRPHQGDGFVGYRLNALAILLLPALVVLVWSRLGRRGRTPRRTSRTT